MRTPSTILSALAVASFALNGCAMLKSEDDRRCAHKQLPPRPTIIEPSDVSNDLVFARFSSYTGTRSQDDAGRPAYQSIGIDLDDTCTGEGQGPSCLEPPWAPSVKYQDGVEGIDNALGGAFYHELYPGWPDTWPAMGTDAGTDEEEIFRVRGYSGQPDDDEVEVDLYAALGLDPREDGGTAPTWDGNDHWKILREMLASPGYDVDGPEFVDSHAYVSHEMLVAQFTNVNWPAFLILAPDSVYRVAQLVLTGHLTNESGPWELRDLVVSMRIRINDYLPRAARFQDIQDASAPVCGNDVGFESTKRIICSYEDISSGADSVASPCDALSMAVLIQAKQAQLGSVRDWASDLPPCALNVHPDTDMCQSLAGP